MEFELDGSLKEWVKDKPLSILQLDPADRAVLRIAEDDTHMPLLPLPYAEIPMVFGFPGWHPCLSQSPGVSWTVSLVDRSLCYATSVNQYPIQKREKETNEQTNRKFVGSDAESNDRGESELD
ncbi:unnamed protein product [Xylocopa violacea]|uniref:Uncharacterized protein n=1 Tax=Xylocopa violacea TaxID=135666 RepID=A0ABP1N0P2_XYLVO